MDAFAANYIKPRTSNLTNMNASLITNKRQAQMIFTGYARQVEAIPGIATFFPTVFNASDLRAKGFIPYGVDEFKGDMASSIVLIGTQYKLLEKIAYLTEEVAKLIF